MKLMPSLLKHIVKALLTLSLMTSFSGSQGQELPPPTEREFKEWVLAIAKQNQNYQNKLIIKEKIIAELDIQLNTKDNLIDSYERDSIQYESEILAYREGWMRQDTIIATQESMIRKVTKQRNLALGGTALILLLSIIKLVAF